MNRSRTFLWLAVLLSATAALALTWLVFPATPASVPGLRFEGFVTLPKGRGAGLLNVLDYLTIDGGQLFVTNTTAGTVYKVHLRENSVPRVSDISTLDLEPAAHGVAIDPESGFGFVSRSEANTVDIFDPRRMRFIRRLAVADDPDSIFYLPFAKLIYVASGDANTATLIDPVHETVVARIALGGKPEFAAFPANGPFVYQNLEDKNAIAVVDISKRQVVDRWQLTDCEAPTGAAISAADNLLFVGCSGNARLIAIDMATHRAVASVSIGRGTDTVAFDPALRRIYSTGRAGTLVMVQLKANRQLAVRASLSLHYGAHTLAIDPSSLRVYVGYASLLIAPRLAVFSVNP